MDNEKEKQELKTKSTKAVAGSLIASGAILLSFAFAVCLTKGKIIKKII